jgi:hypothetical protein
MNVKFVYEFKHSADGDLTFREDRYPRQEGGLRNTPIFMVARAEE